MWSYICMSISYAIHKYMVDSKKVYDYRVTNSVFSTLTHTIIVFITNYTIVIDTSFTRHPYRSYPVIGEVNLISTY